MTTQQQTERELDYAVAPPEGIAPVIFRAMLIQTMAFRYRKAVPDLTYDEAYEAAKATWETEWDDHPAPRTLEAAQEAVDSDLAYWTED